jgi:glycosyltransferase involved in cell wall biosynthesis
MAASSSIEQSSSPEQAAGLDPILTNSLDLTICVPCKNEEKNVLGTLQAIVEALSEVGCSYEIIVIDDGSTDQTSALVEQFLRKHASLPIRLYKNPKNLGLSRTYVNGAFLGRGKYYRYIGGDNAEPKEAIVKILKMMGKADIIIPFHEELVGKSFHRVAISRLYTFLVNLLSGYSINYYNGCAVHLRYNVLRWHSYAYGFGFQADMITRLLQQGATYVQVPVRVGHTNKGPGASPFHIRNIVSTGHTLFEILRRRINVLLFGQ